MFTVSVERNGHQIHKVDCEALCLAYSSEGSIKSVVSAEPDVNVDNVLLLGCSASSAALRAISVNKEDSTTGTGDEDTLQHQATVPFITRVR